MKNIILASLLMLAAVSPFHAALAENHELTPLPTPHHTLKPPAASDGSFTFVAGGDNRPTSDGEPIPPSCEEIFREVGYIRPDLVLWTGDAIEGFDDSPAQADSEYSHFLASAALSDTPIFAIPGNHEATLDPAMIQRYIADMGPLYGSFDYAGSHFIGLDSTPIQADGKIHEGTIDDDQLAWLKSDLAAHQSAVNIFVFFHHYMYGPPDPDIPNGPDTGLGDTGERDMLHQLFVQYHVRAVFNGHNHMFYHVAKDGIDYYIAGNAGAPFDAPPEEGGFLGYTLVHVNGAKLTVENLTPWALFVRPASGGDGKAKIAQAAVSAYDYYDLDTRGVSLLMPHADSYLATAETRYKGKAPAAKVVIDHVEPASSGEDRVYLNLHLKHGRTTYVTVTAR